MFPSDAILPRRLDRVFFFFCAIALSGEKIYNIFMFRMQVSTIYLIRQHKVEVKIIFFHLCIFSRFIRQLSLLYNVR